MAVNAMVMTKFGEERELYIRVNNIESSNHGVESNALFRGYISQEAFQGGAHYVWENNVSFIADVTIPLWDQAYGELKRSMPDVEFIDSL
ncbi:hypothetical protein [Aeromonas sp. ARM81]|uniref:hypothetical protein n=1 Tax=Aeromonas sp. ARM81 TaxID=1747384 RepID=UPI00090BD589|nr:hypothetical protein [Aeromonas sp. ARM81]ALN97537.1 hypothetical protein ARM81ld_p17 [Aeromonas phage phiARM81ld]RDD48686.1 hypothetical protein ASJ36_18020 [Aeromonas sp. ARM81]